MKTSVSKLALAVAALAVLPGAAFAQTSGSTAPPPDHGAPTGIVDELVVTATKRPATIGELTQPATIVTNAEILNEAHTSLTDVLRQQPGIQFEQAGGPGQLLYPRLRGFSDSILYTFDGMTLNGGGTGGLNYLLGQVDPTMIGRIEVLRGPHATLYGANSTAGVIALTSKVATDAETNASAEYGSLDWKKGHIGTENLFHIGEGVLNYSLDGSRIDSGGVNKYEASHNSSITGRLAYDIRGFQFGVSSYVTQNSFNAAQLLESSPPATRQNYFAVQIPDANNWDKTDLYIGTVWAQQKITDQLTQKLMAGFADQRFHIQNPGNFLGTYSAPYDGWVDPNTFDTYSKGQSVPVTAFALDYSTMERDREVDYNLRYDNGRVSGVAGATYLGQTYATGGSGGGSSASEHDVSGYGNVGVSFLGNKLHTEVGGRIDNYSAWGSQGTYSVGANYEAIKGLNLYINYGTSFTAPTLGQLYDPIYGSSHLTPATAGTWEGGLRWTALDSRLTGSVTVWDSYVRNVIVYDGTVPNPKAFGGFGAYANGSAEKSRGVEVEAAYKIAPEVILNANYTLTDAQVSGGGYTGAGGWAPMPESAHDIGNVGITYEPQKFTVNANLFITSPRLRYAGDVAAPAYARLDLSGRYHLTHQIDLYARVQNALNQNIVEQLGYRNPKIYAIGGIAVRF